MADPLATLALCSGAGGIELGLSLVVRTRVVAFVERDPYAAAVLLARMEDEALEPAPVWCGDLALMDTRPFVGVDLVTAGFPCQPWSAAGKRRGTDDERWLWPLIAAVVRQVGPRLVFLENVPGLLGGGLGHVLADLAALGFDAEWTCLRASDVGAPHRRERVFVLAHSDGDGLPLIRRQAGQWERDVDGPRRPHVADTGGARRQQVARGAPGHEGEDAGRAEVGGYVAERGGEAVAHADGSGGDERAGRAHVEGRGIEPAYRGVGQADTSVTGREGEVLRRRAAHGGAAVADAEGERPGEPAVEGPAIGGERARPSIGGCGVFPPGPDDHDGWRRLLDAEPGLEPSLRRDADGLASRLDRLRVIGNGVVPQQVAFAFVGLARRSGLW